MNERLKEIMGHIGSRPALIHMPSAALLFGDEDEDDDAPYDVQDGVAIINISGPLSNARWSWGGTTYGSIQEQVRKAGSDQRVKAVLLNVNSPGGATDNAFETADAIAALGKQKPVWACSATMAYSAAYLLASQAEKIYCTPTSGGVGSIGVYCAHMDISEALKKEGVAVTLISAGDGKTDGNPYEPLSKSARAELQGEIDRLYGEFISAVARGRNMDATAVVKLGARLYDGAQSAIASGLADMPGDLSTAWVDLCTTLQRGDSSPLMRARKSSVASATNSKQENSMEGNAKADAAQSAEAEKKLAEAVASAKSDGFAEAAEIVDLCALAGMPHKAAGFIGERKTAEQVRKDLMAAKAEGQKGTEINGGVMPGADVAAPSQTQGKAKPWGEILGSLGFKKRGN